MYWRGMAAALFLALSLPWLPRASAGEVSWPGRVYDFAQLDEARQAARDAHMPVTFLFTEKNSTCPLCRDANRDVVSQLGTKSAVVYINSRDTSLRLPAAVSAALSSKESGQFIPKTVITDEPAGTVLYILPYADRKARPALMRQALEEIDKYSRR